MRLEMDTNILLCGVGGQGTVLASRLLAEAAMEKGRHVRTAETIGMAQRGGGVVSHVRIGDEIHSPLIPKGGADVILGFEPGEAVRCLPYLKPEGTLVVNTKAVKPVTATLGGDLYEGSDMLTYLRLKVKNLITVDGDSVCDRCGSPKVLNTALVAAGAKAGCLDLTLEELQSAIRSKMKEKYHAPNLMAVEILWHEMD